MPGSRSCVWRWKCRLNADQIHLRSGVIPASHTDDNEEWTLQFTDIPWQVEKSLDRHKGRRSKDLAQSASASLILDLHAHF